MFERRFNTELKLLGERIKKIRVQKGLLQENIEVFTGISRQDVSKIEHGKKNIEFYTLVRLAAALEVETWELLKPQKP